MMHQHQQGLVGPIASGKFYSNLEDTDEYSLNLEIRRKITKVGHTVDLHIKHLHINHRLTLIWP